MKACKKYFAWVLPIIVYFLVQVMGLIICLLYENVSRLIIKNSKKDINITMETILLSEDGKRTFSIVVIIMTIVIFGIWHKKIRTSRIGYRDGLYIKRIMVLIILGICMQLGFSSLLNITLSVQKDWLDAYKEHMSWTKTDSGLFTIIYIVIAAPMIEELIFRGVILERCRRNLPLITANIIQALIFGVFHQNMIQGFYAFVAGICIGIVYVKYHSLVSAIIVHIVMNGGGILLNLIMSNINEINIVTLFVFAIIGCLSTALCLMRIIQEDKNKNSENYCNIV